MTNTWCLSTTIFLIGIILTKCKNYYYQTLTTDYTKLNSLNSTVVISESRDIGTCTCDLTPNTCDYLCCCDIDCPSKITSVWLDDPNNICLDKSKNKKINNLFLIPYRKFRKQLPYPLFQRKHSLLL
jgi:hypothetical protein